MSPSSNRSAAKAAVGRNASKADAIDQGLTIDGFIDSFSWFPVRVIVRSRGPRNRARRADEGHAFMPHFATLDSDPRQEGELYLIPDSSSRPARSTHSSGSNTRTLPSACNSIPVTTSAQSSRSASLPDRARGAESNCSPPTPEKSDDRLPGLSGDDARGRQEARSDHAARMPERRSKLSTGGGVPQTGRAVDAPREHRLSVGRVTRRRHESVMTHRRTDRLQGLSIPLPRITIASTC